MRERRLDDLLELLVVETRASSGPVGPPWAMIGTPPPVERQRVDNDPLDDLGLGLGHAQHDLVVHLGPQHRQQQAGAAGRSSSGHGLLPGP
jgi:hypothetical protein